MQQFNKISTQSNFIKNLLATTYLPLIRTVREGDYLSEDLLYVFRCNIIKCTQSGYIGSKDILFNAPICKYRVLGEYYFGDRNGKLCTNFISNKKGYDYKTHERLGQYLRNLRDMYGLNLMPLYNCFSNQPFETHHIFKNRVAYTRDDYKTKLFKVPVRFNQDYTICIENVGVTTIAPAFIKNNQLLKLNNTRFGNGIEVTNRYNSLHSGEMITSYSNTSFRQPFVVRFNNMPESKRVTYTITNDVDYSQTFDSADAFNTFLEDTRFDVLDFSETFHDLTTLDKKLLKRYFVKVDLTEDEFNTRSYTLYHTVKHKSSSTKVPPTYTFEIVTGSYDSDDTYYKAIVNPSDRGWYIFDTDTNEFSKETDSFIGINKYYIPLDTTVTKEKVYDIDIENCNFYNKIEQDLYMLIQVPSSFDQNIVVLEGDYTRTKGFKEIDNTLVYQMPDFMQDFLYTHNLSLMNCTSDNVIPFSNVLIQFLLWNAISGMDSINNDMDRISTKLKEKRPDEYLIKITNYWHEAYRKLVSDYAYDNGEKYCQDNLGYITTDIEQLINKEM